VEAAMIQRDASCTWKYSKHGHDDDDDGDDDVFCAGPLCGSVYTL